MRRVMEVEIKTFPRTRVAYVEHHGSPSLEYLTAKNLNEWRAINKQEDWDNSSFAIYFTRRYAVQPHLHRVDFAIQYSGEVTSNNLGIKKRDIPEMRCAVIRDVGNRYQTKSIDYLRNIWLPYSCEQLSGEPEIYHYLNTGPRLRPAEMITDIYLPLLSIKGNL